MAIGKEKLSKWMEVLLATPPDSGPHVCVIFSVLCRHLKQIGDDASIEQHKVCYIIKAKISKFSFHIGNLDR